MADCPPRPAAGDQKYFTLPYLLSLLPSFLKPSLHISIIPSTSTVKFQLKRYRINVETNANIFLFFFFYTTIDRRFSLIPRSLPRNASIFIGDPSIRSELVNVTIYIYKKKKKYQNTTLIKIDKQKGNRVFVVLESFEGTCKVESRKSHVPRNHARTIGSVEWGAVHPVLGVQVQEVFP